MSPGLFLAVNPPLSPGGSGWGQAGAPEGRGGSAAREGTCLHPRPRAPLTPGRGTPDFSGRRGRTVLSRAATTTKLRQPRAPAPPTPARPHLPVTTTAFRGCSMAGRAHQDRGGRDWRGPQTPRTPPGRQAPPPNAGPARTRPSPAPEQLCWPLHRPAGSARPQGRLYSPDPRGPAMPSLWPRPLKATPTQPRPRAF